jgi:integrase
MSSRQIHRLSEVQIRNARPIKEVITPEGADHALATGRKHPGIRLAVGNPPVPIQHQDVRDGRVVRRRTRWLCDGGSLWVKVMPSQTDPDGCSKSYVFRYSLPEEITSSNGKRYQRQRQMGLGPCSARTLAEAREKAREYRTMLLDGIDPLVAKQGKAAAGKVAELRAKTFDVVTTEFLQKKGANEGWSAVHSRNWAQSIRDHISPIIGNVPLASIDTATAIRALADVWEKHPVTASRVRGRCEAIWDFGALLGYVDTADGCPFRWRGHLEHRFTPPTKVEHLPALPFAKMSSLWGKLVKVEVLAALALRWTILTVARTNETMAALASEIDHERQEWRVPRSHKKTRRHMEDDDFIQPLTDEAMAVLAKIGKREPGERLFPVHAQAMLWCIQDIVPDITVHGTTRGAFKTWSREATDTDSDVVRACMSHKGGASAVDLAYHRGPLYVEKKRRHLQLWANYVCGVTESADVIPLVGKRA